MLFDSHTDLATCGGCRSGHSGKLVILGLSHALAVTFVLA
jgi:hypothetical protein